MYLINKRPDGKFEVKKKGSKRASKVFDTRAEAIAYCEKNNYEYKLNGDDGVSKTVNSVKKHGILKTLLLIIIFALIGVGAYFVYNTFINNKKPSNVPTIIDGANFSIHFLELGNKNNGDSTFIKAGDNDILIDAGSKRESASTIKAYIDNFCTDGKLEYVIATHAHFDHIAALVGNNNDGILYQYQIENLIQFSFANTSSGTYRSYLSAVETLKNKGTNVYTAAECWNNENGAKRSFPLGENMSLDIVYNKYYFEVAEDENDYSVCTMFRNGNHSFLLTGDLELEGETQMALFYDGSTPEKTLPKVDVFKAGHHGSKTSSNHELLSIIEPKICCVCCCAGYNEYTARNTSIFPTQAFIDRISQYTDKVYVTSKFNQENNDFESLNGNICVSSNGTDIAVNCSNNNTILKDSAWFNEEIYVKNGYVSPDKKTDYYNSLTPNTKKIIRREWPKNANNIL